MDEERVPAPTYPHHERHSYTTYAGDDALWRPRYLCHRRAPPRAQTYPDVPPAREPYLRGLCLPRATDSRGQAGLRCLPHDRGERTGGDTSPRGRACALPTAFPRVHDCDGAWQDEA